MRGEQCEPPDPDTQINVPSYVVYLYKEEGPKIMYVYCNYP